MQGEPEVGPDELSARWTVTYTKEGVRPFVLPGRTRARYRDGKIAHMTDSYEPHVTTDTIAWMQKNGMTFDGSYV